MKKAGLRYGLIAAALLLGGCAESEPQHITVYSGRGKSLVDPLVQKFQNTSGITVDVRYGDTAELTVALMEEGDRSSADLFWAQDAGALGAAVSAGLLGPLPDSIISRVPAGYRGSTNRWVGTSGRARTLAYSPSRLKTNDLPTSVFDLTQNRFRGRVGWAPSNGSFQAFVTAMRSQMGEDRTRQWLLDMKANGARSYPKNTAILQGIANGEIDLGLPNHYYLLRFKSEDPAFPVEQASFRAGDVGNLMNVAGIGLLNSSQRKPAALAFVDFLLREEAQAYFATETFEFPLVNAPTAAAGPATPPDSLMPRMSLDDLRDLESTLDLLREVGLL